MTRSFISRALPGLLVTAALVAACGGAKPAAPAAGIEPLRVSVTLKDFRFEPKEITAVKGQKIILTLKNTGERDHDLVLQGPYNGMKSQHIQNGQETTLEFVADQVGTFEFICDLKGHKDRGMVGTLVVKEK